MGIIMGANDEVVKTGVDELLEILKFSTKIPLSEVAKKLTVSMEVAQAWVDFLVEEGIVGIEYKFTTPYIYLNKPIEIKQELGDEKVEELSIFVFKKQFWDKARKNNIPENKIELLWKNHLLQEIELKKKYFFFEAQNRRIKNAEELWEEYQSNLLVS